ncbi:MAG: hypothetical protein AB7H93_23605 [Vicinamibacterales bacterium]
MPSTIREQAQAAFTAALEGMGGTPAVAVDVNRLAPVLPSQMPCLNVIDGGHEARDLNAGAADFDMTITVACAIAEAEGVAQRQAVNALYGRIVAALLADPTLGGVAYDVREVSMSDPVPDAIADAAGNIVSEEFTVFEVVFAVAFVTDERDRTSLAPN